MTRTIDDATYAYNRRPENRRIYAEQQIDRFYADLLMAQWRERIARGMVDISYWTTQQRNAELALADAHARLAALDGHGPLCAGTHDPVECDCGPEGGPLVVLEHT